MRGGPRIRSPIKTAEKAEIRTAAAPTSLPRMANGCCCGLARSTTASKALFRNSANQTRLMAMSRIAHSTICISRKNPRKTTRIVTTACIQALRCVRVTYHHPLKAFLNDCARERIKFTNFQLFQFGNDPDTHQTQFFQNFLLSIPHN